MASAVYALMPMKLHSERVAGKNFRLLAGEPLFCYTLRSLLAAASISHVYINTDAVHLRDLITRYFPAEAHRITVLERPLHLCGDAVPMTQILASDCATILKQTGTSDEATFIQTHATNPLLSAATIDAAVSTFTAAYPDAHDSLFSVTVRRARLYDHYGRAINHEPELLLRTQDLSPVYEENSVLYVFKAALLEQGVRIGKRPLMYETPLNESFDIDTQADWDLVHEMVSARKASRSPKTVLVSAPYVIPHMARFRDILRHFGLNVVVPEGMRERLTEEQLLSLAGTFDATICGDDHYTERVLRACSPRLTAISKWGTGIDSIDAATAKALGVTVCNTPGAFTQPVADSAMSYILAFARNMAATDASMKEGSWTKLGGRCLAECTIGCIGCGAIGQALCERLAGFGTRVFFVDPVPPPAAWLAANPHVSAASSLSTLAGACDFVALCCDLNPSSKHIINAETLACMRPGAFIVNTARGGLVDELQLIAALKSGKIAGAGLDVFEDEPLPVDSPLRSMSTGTVLLSAHNANASPACHERVHFATIANLLRALNIHFEADVLAALVAA